MEKIYTTPEGWAKIPSGHAVFCFHCHVQVGTTYDAQDGHYPPGHGRWFVECPVCDKKTYFDVISDSPVDNR